MTAPASAPPDGDPAPTDGTAAGPPPPAVKKRRGIRAARSKAKKPKVPTPTSVVLISTILGIIAALSLTFVAELTVLGTLQYNRHYITARDDLRADLANATAPLGPLDDKGKLLAEGRPVALLDIPSLGVSAIVGEGTSSAVTMVGLGHRRDSVMPGQVGISVVAGRSSMYGAPFADLARLTPGATITTTTGQGKATYAVTAVRRAGDPVPQPPAAGQARLILVTADGPRFQPTGAVLIDAQAQTTPFEAAKQLSASDLPPQEDVMKGDTTNANLFGLVLWSQALLLVALGLSYAAIRWGRWPTWLVGIPTLLATVLEVIDHAARMLPNVL